MAVSDKLIINNSDLVTGEVSLTSDLTEDRMSADVFFVDFADTGACSRSTPVSCHINGMKVNFVGNWRDLLSAITEYCITEFPDKTENLKLMWFSNHSNTPYLLSSKPPFAGKKISGGYWINVNYSISQLVSIIAGLCRYCGVSLDDVEIKYTPKSEGEIVKKDIDSSLFSQVEIREAFKAWLAGQHPNWNRSALNGHFADAYYLYNNNRGITLAEALVDDNGIQRAYNAILHHFEQSPTQIQPSVRASGYRRSLQLLKGFLTEKFPELLTGSATPVVTIPKSILDVLRTDFASGFRLETTALRLLSSKAGVEVDNALQSELRRILFHRGDDVYFLLDVVTATEIRKDIVDFAKALLDEYGCFEISEFYALYADKLNPKCIDGAEDFEKFYECICSQDIRCVAAPQIGNRIARYSTGNVWGAFDMIAQKIIAVTNDEFGGVISEEDLHKKFFAFSTDLLAKIIKNCIGNELLCVEINGIVCYQTFEALGLPKDFSKTLSDTLYRLDDLGLITNEEVLHTALSLALGVNLKEEYNIPNQATYRRLIDVYYKSAPPRKWKYGIFEEVSS